jgi:hypothetical protein
MTDKTIAASYRNGSRRYYELCSRQPTKWLVECLANPSAHQTTRHLALIKLVLRHRNDEASRA